MTVVVLDTNVVVAALRSGGGRSRSVLRRAIDGRDVPLFGTTLWLEYEEILGRGVADGATSRAERETVLAALVTAGRWVQIYYGWRPNLPDEGDNHLVELALAGNAESIITWNPRDIAHGDLVWPGLSVQTPQDYLEDTS